jgi:photosystem II stability/assembly factor-like uncharacterized protein
MKKMRRAFALISAVLCNHTGVALGGGWTNASTGLTGSVPALSAVVIDRETGSTLYALTSGNSIFKSTDGGASWSAVGNIIGVLVLALDPTSASIIYAGTAHGVFKSTDGGDSWVSAGLSGASISVLAIDPTSPSNLYAAGASGDTVYRSTDAGASWTAARVGLPPGQFNGIGWMMLDPLAPSTLYVLNSGSGFSSSALYKSTDGGQSWSVVNPGPYFVRLLGIAPTAPSTLYAIIGGRGGGLSISKDGGATWTATAFMQDVWALAIDPTNPNTMYAAASAPVGTAPPIFKSTDGGQTWDSGNTTIPFARSLVLSPVNSSTIYAATTGGVFKSTDAEANWSEANSGLRILGIQVLVGDPMDPATIYAGGDEGLFKSVDGGAIWNQRAAFKVTCCTPPPGLPPDLPPPVVPFFPPVAPASVHALFIDSTNPNILYVGTARTNGCYFADILLFKSTDGGATWSDSISPNRDQGGGCFVSGLIGVDPTDPNTLYLRVGDFYDGYGLRKTIDGGANWTPVGLGSDAEFVVAIDPTLPATLYAGTDRGVFRSTDGGATWNLVGLTQTNVNLLAIDPLRPNVLYAGTSGVYPDPPGSRGLFKSTDRGASWSPINVGLEDVLNTHASISALILDPDRTDTLYASTSGYGVFKSPDGGATWVPFNDGLTHFDVRVLAITAGPSRTVYAGTPGGVFKIVENGY